MGEVENLHFAELRKIDNCYRYNIENSFDEEFENLQGHTYVDHAATGLYSKKQLASVFNTLSSSVFGNPHSRHLPSDIVTQAIDAARNRILEHFNTSNEEYDVIFTSGATDAIKIVANNFYWSDNTFHQPTIGKQQRKKINSSFVYTQENHTSVLGIRELASGNGACIYSLLANEVIDLLREPDINNFSTLRKANEDNVTDIGLFAYPGQCNFSGSKYPLEWINKVHNGKLNSVIKKPPMYTNGKVAGNSKQASPTIKWFVLLDAASLIATSPLNLEIYKPDFVPISFYKMFGYPTGIGCLLVSKRATSFLHKRYFGGGTVQMVDSTTMIVNPRMALHERFEDGTLPFLSILALEHGFSTLLRIAGPMKCIEDHVFNISYYLYCNMKSMRHSNHEEVVKIYSDAELWSKDIQGPIVNFNITDSSGNYVGFTHVERVASLYNIYLRTGCVCNPGACQKYLKISSLKLQQQYKAGHVCGDTIDVVDGFPTGSVRVSFGYTSTYDDADKILLMIKECFVDGQMIYDKNWYYTILKNQQKCRNIDNLIPDDTPIGASNFKNFSPHVGSEDVAIIQEKTCQISNRLNESSYQLISIILYPVKSCSGIMVPKWNLGNYGLEFDRQWMIVTASGITLTSKRKPHMCLIKPSINFGMNVLELTFEGKGSVSVTLSVNDTDRDQEEKFWGGRVCGDRVKGLDCGDAVGEWLSMVLGIKDLRLIRQLQGRKNRLSNSDETSEKVGKVSLANESQYLIIHEASTQHLLRQIKDREIENELSEDDLKLRFRPNFIISGGNFYEEDTWDSISIGANVFKIHGCCTRCLTVCVNPETAEYTKEPLLTLAATRGTNMKFGVHASYLKDPDNISQNYIQANMMVNVKKKMCLDL